MTAENTHALDGIELADAVASIRNQLIDAATRATDHPVSFAVGDIQMEFTLELRREAKAGGKVKAWVVEAGTDAALASGRTHKVAFTLTPPQRRDGRGVGDRDAGRRIDGGVRWRPGGGPRIDGRVRSRPGGGPRIDGGARWRTGGGPHLLALVQRGPGAGRRVPGGVR